MQDTLVGFTEFLCYCCGKSKPDAKIVCSDCLNRILINNESLVIEIKKFNNETYIPTKQVMIVKPKYNNAEIITMDKEEYTKFQLTLLEKNQEFTPLYIKEY